MSPGGCTENCCEKATEWKTKYENCEEKLLQLKKLSHEGVKEHEALQRKYDQNHKQYEQLKSKLEEAQMRLGQLENVLEPVSIEYQEMTEKVQVMEMCRVESERYATKVSQQNKKLKRQSQMLFKKLSQHHVDIEIDALGEITDEGNEETADTEVTRNGERDGLNKLVQNLRQETTELSERVVTLEAAATAAVDRERAVVTQLDQSNTEKSALEEEIKLLHKTILERNETIANLQNVSIRVYQEAQDAQAEAEQQIMLQRVAEEHARKMLKERDAMVRQSSALMMSAASDKRLMQALSEVERLSKEKDEIKHELEAKLHAVEEEKKQFEDYEAEKLRQEEEILTVTNEMSRLKRELDEAAAYRKKLEDEIKVMSQKIEDFEERLRPPPPPPPPPPSAPSIFKPLRFLAKKKPAAGATDKGKQDDGKSKVYQQAVDEMMQRIKQGGPLRPVKPPTERKGSLPGPQNESISELQKMLANLKRSKSAVSIHEKPSQSLNTSSNGPQANLRPVPAPRQSVKETKKGLMQIAEDEEK